VGEENVADLLTKPIEGSRFRKLRRMILNDNQNENDEELMDEAN
jgi:hypothetical protein